MFNLSTVTILYHGQESGTLLLESERIGDKWKLGLVIRFLLLPLQLRKKGIR